MLGVRRLECFDKSGPFFWSMFFLVYNKIPVTKKCFFFQFKRLRILHSWGQVVIFYSDTPRHQTEWNLKEREDVFSESNLELPHLNKISILHKLKDIYLNFHGMGVSVILIIMHKVDMIHKSPVNQLKWKYNTTFNSINPQIRQKAGISGPKTLFFAFLFLAYFMAF